MTDAAGEQRVEGFRRLREQERSMPLSSGQLWTGEDVDLILARLQAVEAERIEATEAFKEKVEDFTGEIARHHETAQRLTDKINELEHLKNDAILRFDEIDRECERLTAELDACERAMLALHESTQRLTAELEGERKRTNYHWHKIAQEQGERAERLTAEVARLRDVVAELEDRDEAERIEHERWHTQQEKERADAAETRVRALEADPHPGKERNPMTMTLSGAGETKLHVQQTATPIYVSGASVSSQEQAAQVNQYVEPAESANRAAVAGELTKLEQIVEYLKVLYR